jgi:uncharacterized protein YbaR (Trm112 family)
MIRDEFLELLRCPLTHRPLRNADTRLVERLNGAIAAATLRSRDGELVTQPLESGLVDEGTTVLYAVRDGIPCLLVDESIPLNQFDEGPGA